MNSSDIKSQIITALKQLYGEREAANMAQYYLDAKRDLPLSKECFEVDKEKMISGIPVQQVVNLSFFYGHKFYINEHVLIPRPETEELVHWIISDLRQTANNENPSILDIGTGSGCIILSLLSKLKVADGHAIDISSEALAVAKKNADGLGLAIDLRCKDILKDGLSEYPDLDIIVSNPPYILSTESELMTPSTLLHEPEKALFVSGTDPLIFYKRIISLGKDKLKKGGCIYFEMSHLHWDAMKVVLEKEAHNYSIKKDMQGQMRMLKIEF